MIRCDLYTSLGRMSRVFFTTNKPNTITRLHLSSEEELMKTCTLLPLVEKECGNVESVAYRGYSKSKTSTRTERVYSECGE